MEETQQDDKDKGVRGVAIMDSVALRLSLHQGHLWNPVWIRLTVWKWIALLLLSVDLDDSDSDSNSNSNSESRRGVREAEPVDAMHRVREVVEAVPADSAWM